MISFRTLASRAALAACLANSVAIEATAGEFADDETGGPDFWLVAGLDAGDTLSVHETPRVEAPVVSRLPEGRVTRNLGCKHVDEQRWCRVLTLDENAEGWVPG